MKGLLRILLLSLSVFLFSSLINFAAGQATLISDQADYAPGTTATFTGSGFHADEVVTMQVLHYDGTSDGGADHQPWEVIADADGNFITTWHVCEDDCVGSTLRATANGNKGSYAEAIFTDANNEPVVTTNPSSQTVCQGSTVTFTSAASGNPNPTVQ